MWDLGADTRTDRWAGHKGRVLGLELDHGGPSFVTVGNDGIFKWIPGQASHVFSIARPDALYGVGASPSGRWLAGVGNSTARIWDNRSGEVLADLGGVASPRVVAFSDDERRVHVGQADGTLVTWDWNGRAATNARRVLSQDGEVLGVISRGSYVLVAHGSRVVAEIDRDTGRELRKFTTSAAPFAIALSPDGRTLASICITDLCK